MITKVPAPEAEGLKVLPATPVPENVPPTGDPFKVTVEALIHIEATGLMLTTGRGLTVTEVESEAEQPLMFV